MIGLENNFIFNLNEETLENLNEEIRGRSSDSKEFKFIFEETTSKINELIKTINSARSTRPRASKDIYMKIKVTAIPLTKEEMQLLIDYIYAKYIREFKGNYIAIRKCIFSNEYLIKSFIRID